jgi:hypothetical protein
VKNEIRAHRNSHCSLSIVRRQRTHTEQAVAHLSLTIMGRKKKNKSPLKSPTAAAIAATPAAAEAVDIVSERYRLIRLTCRQRLILSLNRLRVKPR